MPQTISQLIFSCAWSADTWPWPDSFYCERVQVGELNAVVFVCLMWFLLLFPYKMGTKCFSITCLPHSSQYLTDHVYAIDLSFKEQHLVLGSWWFPSLWNGSNVNINLMFSVYMSLHEGRHSISPLTVLLTLYQRVSHISF